MRKIVLLLVLLAIGTIAFSQEITVRFTGQLNGTSYCRLDSVKVTNLTRDWTETVEYPDTIIVLGGTVGTDLNIVATQGLGQNIPNPFDCETRVELSVSQRENVRMQLLDASGKQYADYRGSLDAGVHTFDISAANPQTYLLNAMVGNRQYSIRMVNVGSGCGSSIKYAGISGGIEAKLTSANEFQIGDNMRYVGYTTIGDQVVASDVKEQAQVVSQYVTLNFTHYSRPIVETLVATDITTTSATLHGNITNNGGTSITARGFYWGTTSDNLSQIVSAGVGDGEYTADITGLSVSTTYYYCAFATNNAGTSIGEVIPFETLSTIGTLNGHEWVDLGLPSGLLWATTNIGAENPEDYGNYYAWGETTTNETYDYDSYIYYEGSTLTKYTRSDNLTTLEASDDAATANWGSGWRMPTQTEMNELFNNCTHVWTTQNGVNGRLFTGLNGNSIFLPAAGYRDGSSLLEVGSGGNYWSSSLYTDDPYGSYRAWYLTFYSGSIYGMSYNYRRWGHSVRPVCVSASSTTSAPTVSTNSAFSITATDATLSGNVTSDGGATVTARGFLYGTSENNLTEDVQSGNGTGSFTKALTGLTSGTTYYYKAYATNSAGTAYGEVRSFTTENIGSTTGTLNGHDYVDLGLPSGTRWATCNIGASSPTAYGDYYAWGETSTKSTYTYDNYTYSDNPTTLPSNADAATANWGADWRMPTMEEVNELINNCTNEWITQNGVSGRLFTGPNGNSIFLPAAGLRDGSELYGADSYGEYWSSSLTDDPYYAWYLGFGSVDSNMDSYYRYCGQSVRPVCRFTPTVTTSIASSITTTGATLNGNITSDGGVTVTDRGFIYGTSESNLIHTVQSGSGTGTFSKTITGLTSVTTYYFKAYATNSEGTVYGEVRSFTTPTGGMGEHYYVDLGLPSGTCWATCNVGAASPEEYGNYYAWGETSTKTTYTEDNYTYSGNPTTLPSSADAATVNWGSGWRMPTQTEMNELHNNCTHVLTTQNGVYGLLFTSNINGNSIFLPGASDNALCTGCYWSSSLGTNSAVSMGASEDYLFISDLFIARYYGLSVRPVCSNCGSSVATPTVTTVTASSITSTGATLSGNITTDGGAAVTSRGFLYGTNYSNLTQTVQSGSGTGSFAKALTGLTSGTTYYYKAYATNSAGTAYGEVRSFTTPSTLNGHDWVDLGLPSGIKWAICNVGAYSPEEYGDYYAWGETSTKATYTEDNYSYSGNPTTLPSSADAATANWGSGWRMPTYDELNELKNNCIVTWTTLNGVNGRLFTGPNGNSIFLPAAGYRYDSELYHAGSDGICWSSSLYTGGPDCAWDLGFGSDDYGMYYGGRFCGLSVRPVCAQ